jgi:hypothetical protein
MTGKRVPLELRDSLLHTLEENSYNITVRREATANGDRILVVAYPGSSLKDSDVPTEYRGFPVRFEQRPFPEGK